MYINTICHCCYSDNVLYGLILSLTLWQYRSQDTLANKTHWIEWNWQTELVNMIINILLININMYIFIGYQCLSMSREAMKCVFTMYFGSQSFHFEGQYTNDLISKKYTTYSQMLVFVCGPVIHWLTCLCLSCSCTVSSDITLLCDLRKSDKIHWLLTDTHPSSHYFIWCEFILRFRWSEAWALQGSL